MSPVAEKMYNNSCAMFSDTSSEIDESEQTYRDQQVERLSLEHYLSQPNEVFTGKERPSQDEGTFAFPLSSGSPAKPQREAEWDGYVVGVEERYFTAELMGIYGDEVHGKSFPAEVPFNEIGQSDLDLIRPGAFFRICTYFQLDEDERPKRFAKVIFRRLPAYRHEDLQQADKRADNRHDRLRVE